MNHETIQDDSQTILFFNRINSENQLVAPHWHSHMEILYIHKGRLDVSINDRGYSLKNGDILLINPRDIHHTRMLGHVDYHLLQISEYHLLRMSENFAALEFEELFESEHPHYESLKRHLDSMISLQTEKQEGYQLLLLIQLYEILYLLLRSASSQRLMDQHASDRDFNRIEACMHHVREHYCEPISLQDMSELLALSPEYISRLFKRYTGQSFLTYVMQIRLTHFHKELLSGNDSIETLMDRNGFTSYKTLMKYFHEIYHTTPTALRKKDAATQN